MRDRVLELRNGLITDSAASTNQGWPMKWMPLNRTGNESCGEEEKKIFDKLHNGVNIDLTDLQSFDHEL